MSLSSNLNTRPQTSKMTCTVLPLSVAEAGPQPSWPRVNQT